MRINVYFILISESSPYVLSYRSIYSHVNTVGNFSTVLIEILFTNSWRRSFAKLLPIPKLSLHNSVAFLSSAKASQRFAWKSNFLIYAIAWLTPRNFHKRLYLLDTATTYIILPTPQNYRLVAALSVRACALTLWQPTLKHSPLNVCTEQIMAVLCSLTCAAVILSLLQENYLSNSIPHRGKCRTKAVNHLSRSLETWKMLTIILSKLNFINWQNQWYHTKLCFNMNLAMCNLPPNMKSSSHKTWQPSFIFFKLLQYKT